MMKRVGRYLLLLVLLLMPCFVFAEDAPPYVGELHFQQPLSLTLESQTEYSLLFIPEENGVYAIDIATDENTESIINLWHNGEILNDEEFYGKAGEKYLIYPYLYIKDYYDDPKPVSCTLNVITSPKWNKPIELNKAMKLSIYDDPQVYFKAPETGFYRFSTPDNPGYIGSKYSFYAFSEDGTKYDPLIAHIIATSDEAIIHLQKGDFCNIYTNDANEAYESSGRIMKIRDVCLTMVPECKYGKTIKLSPNSVTDTVAVCFTPEKKDKYIFDDQKINFDAGPYTYVFDQKNSKDCFIRTKEIWTRKGDYDELKCYHYFRGTPGNTVIKLTFLDLPVTLKTTVLTETEFNRTATIKDKKIPAVRSAKVKAASKGFTVSWKKLSNSQLKKMDRIEVQYSTKKTFPKSDTTSKLIKKSKKSLKISKLKRKKTYYVRVRSVKTVKGLKHVSSWSKTIKTRTK